MEQILDTECNLQGTILKLSPKPKYQLHHTHSNIRSIDMELS